MRAIPHVIALVLAAKAATAIDCQAMEVAGPARVVGGDTLEIGTVDHASFNNSAVAGVDGQTKAGFDDALDVGGRWGLCSL